MSLEDYVEAVRQLHLVGAQLSALKKKDEELKKKINPFVEGNFTPDSRGNRYFTVNDSAGNELILKGEARKSYTLDESLAEELLSEKGVLDRVMDTIEVKRFNEDEIENLVAEGILTMEEFRSICTEKTTYATVFVKKRDAEETP
jgi:hypothetical protein